MTPGLARLTASALYELVRYEAVNLMFGFRHIGKSLANAQSPGRTEDPLLTRRICDAVNLAACFYFKPVRCLQKSVVTVRLLRKCGIDARVVIGYRQAPFFSHAWAEADGQVVNDSPAYKEQLKVLTIL